MNVSFLDLFFEKTDFPQAAKDCLRGIAQKHRAELDGLLSQYQQAYDYASTAPAVEAAAQRMDVHVYTVWLIILILAAEKARPLYRTESSYWDTFCDLKYKAQECFDVYGLWGTFVAYWYPIFYDATIVKLGRMEYQSRPCGLKEPKTVLDRTIKPQDPVIYMHIPTSFEPFDRAARWESYEQAWRWFCPDGRPLVCICSSWLLYPGYQQLFKPESNIAQFRSEFTVVSTAQAQGFSNAWRVFGKDHLLDPAQLPEKTSMQRAFKNHMIHGGTHGSGTGILIFDGKTVCTGDGVAAIM